MTATEIIDKYEVPRELEDVIYLAYTAGKDSGMKEAIETIAEYEVSNV